MTTVTSDLKEFIFIYTPQLEGKYAGLGGTFATLVDGCLRKKMLPGFYDTDLIKTADFQDNKLLLVLSGKRSDAELLSALDVAVRNVGGFPFEGEAPRAMIVEVSGELEI